MAPRALAAPLTPFAIIASIAELAIATEHARFTVGTPLAPMGPLVQDLGAALLSKLGKPFVKSVDSDISFARPHHLLPISSLAMRSFGL